MIKKIMNAIGNNFLLKIVSIIISIVIWYMVVNINDPVETSSFSVRITVENDSYIANGKTSYRIDDANKTVTVYVKTNRSILKSLSSDDITVTADLTQIVDLDRDPVMVPLTASCSGVSATNLTLAKTAIPITIETISSKEFPVTVDTGDSSPGNNYEVGNVTANPDTVVINGPESVINTIESVIAEVDVTGMTQDGNKSATLKLYDKNSEEISEETIEDDLTFDESLDDLTVYVDLWEKRTDVAIEVNYDGEPADGYSVTGVATTPETVTLVGDDDALADLEADGNVITIPAELISVDGASEDISEEINLEDVLPDGLRTAQTTTDTVAVYITILSDETKELSLDVDNIVVENLADDLTVSYDQAELTVRVSGTATALSKVTASSITASIDVDSLTEGDYTETVEVSLPTGVSLDGDAPTISIHLKAKAEPTASASE